MLKKKLVRRPKTKVIPLTIAPAGAFFWVNNGPPLRHLLDLSKFLAIITEEQFSYHTKRAGNDFAKWVEAILGDKLCARALEKSKTVATARLAVSRALKRYNV
ncbi:MAG: hypothetical protein V1704_00545 [Candidatus Vogelbacteria bacterium]